MNAVCFFLCSSDEIIKMNSINGNQTYEKKFVAEHIDTINDLLEETFRSSQRIKLICYDVSRKYIVFGANNGSIHIYRRGPNADFLKLIPSRNSAAIEQISISPNEENIFLADESGIILVLENCFLDRPSHSHIYPERRGKKITAVKWDSDSKVYVGDNEGTVSVISVSSIVRLALLHTPFISLMDLGSPIVQIDSCSRFMLITTERKSYICDTEREMYKQVGRKDNGKALGACFYNTDGEIPDTIEDFEKNRLYCTRPGLRMWEANFEGEVYYTHKYRNAVPNINEILTFREGKNADLETENVTPPKDESRNFGKILVFNQKYLCAISAKSLYVIDPENNHLVFYYYSSLPVDVRLVDHEINIWCPDTGKLRVLNFYSFDDLMSSIFEHKHFKAGVQFVIRNKKDVIDWSKYSQNVHLVTDLKSELENMDPETVQKFREVLEEMVAYERDLLGEYKKDDDPKIGNLSDEEDTDSESDDEDDEDNEELQLMIKQYKLSESNGIVLMPKFTEMLLNMSEDEMTEFFLDFIDYLTLSNEEVRLEWIYTQYMHHFYLHKGYLKLNEMNNETVDFLTKCFLELNKNVAPACACSFPLPTLNKIQPKYDAIGRALSEYSEQHGYKLQKIPHLWLHEINKLCSLEDMEQNLPLILQYGYMEIIKKASKHITYDFCDNLIGLFVKLKAGNCLNCGKSFSDEHCKQIPDFEYLGLTLIQYIGADSVLKLFLNRHEDIPKDELSEKFYMACMFSQVQNNVSENGVPRNRATEMASNFVDNRETQTEFKNYLGAFLMGKVDKNVNAEVKKKLTCSSCSYCTILLNHPVLNQVEQLDCGHAFHAICLLYIKRICNICFSI